VLMTPSYVFVACAAPRSRPIPKGETYLLVGKAHQEPKLTF
jgi:hypothetical protein